MKYGYIFIMKKSARLDLQTRNPKRRKPSVRTHKKPEKPLNPLIQEEKPKKIEKQPEKKEENQYVSPEVIRTTFDSLNVFIENMQEYYFEQIKMLKEKIKETKNEIDRISNRT